jgi:starch synthase
MRLLLASSEIEPYAKTGGLADMAAALGKYLARAGHRVGIVTPLHRGMPPDLAATLRPLPWSLDLPLGAAAVHADVRIAQPEPNLTLYFVDAPRFFDRAGLYLDPVSKHDYWDNAERYIFFSKAVVNLARYLPWKPEIMHVHDWHTAMAPLLVRHQAWHDGWSDAPRTVLTVHNLAPQGRCHASKYALTNLPAYYFHADAAEFWGDFNPLKAGLVFADAITTVSPTYAREILTPAYGEGLDGVLLRRQHALTGILNGVDYEKWRTTGNPHLVADYTVDDLAGKAANKAALQAEMGLPVRADVPLLGTISRLEPQKGADLILAALEEMLASPIQYVLLGSGRSDFEEGFRSLTRRYPAQVAARIGYDAALAHRIEAACDFYLMPSRFEPCGLNQMYSLRYGAVPVVRATGGLQDSITDLREDTARADGIKFQAPTAAALAKAIRKGLALWSEPALLALYRRHGMFKDFSWRRSVGEYEALYRRLLWHGRPSA